MAAKAKNNNYDGNKAVKRSSSLGRKRVNFIYKAKPGMKVFVAGDFNNWDETAKQLKDSSGTGEYKVTMLLPKGTYEYKFKVDGKWCVDPNNPNFKPNGLGTLNSVLEVI